MAKGRVGTYGMALTVLMLLTLSVWMAPAAEALPSYLTAPWTPLAVPNGDDGLTHTAPWTPLSIPNGGDGFVYTTLAASLSGPEGNNESVETAPWTPLSLPDGNEGTVHTPGTVRSLVADDIVGPISLASDPPAAAAAPEPATVILLGIGILALMIIGWRRAESLRRG